MSNHNDLVQENLHRLFYPESVAVVGTNKVKGTVPYDILENILKAELNGIVYPVNPKHHQIASIRTYKYVIDIPDPVDLGIIVFPSSVCHMALEQCGQKGIKSVVIISAGFREVGEAGAERERKLVEIAKKYGMSFIGPNCLGVINTDPASNLNASFAREMPQEGNIAFLSQSGALCTAVLDYARAKHIGFSKFISFGNKADISEMDLLKYLKDDERTKVILMYLEEVTNGSALMETAREVINQSGKPILVVKSGRTEAGASAASSHTGSLAGSDEVCDAAFKQAGIIRCNNIEEMFNKAIAFAYQPPPESNRIAIITNAGGPGVLTADAASHNGLDLAVLSQETTALFKKHLPATANIKNPVDVIGDAKADRYRIALEGAFKDPSVDAVFVILTPQSMTNIENIATEITLVADEFDKPVYASFMGEYDVADGIDILQKHKIPHYILPESMCVALSTVITFHKEQKNKNIPTIQKFEDINKQAVSSIIEDAIERGISFITEDKALEILKAYGIPGPEYIIARSVEDAIKAFHQMKSDVVLKIVSPDIIHKFDSGGVMTGLSSEQDVAESYDKIIHNVKKNNPDARIEGILVSRMITDSLETVIGLKKDDAFGPVIMFGLGGIFVEILKDVAFRVCPLDADEANKLIHSVQASKILEGVRGQKPRDVKALQDAILRLSNLALDHPRIAELDINPLMVLEDGKGCLAADARILLK